MTDNELFPLIRERLFTAVIGDVMDSVGLTQQFLPPEIRPLDPASVMVGRAMPVLAVDVTAEDAANAGSGEPFGIMFRALDDLRPGEVYVCAGASPRYALWGGLMSTRAMRLGASGAVMEGYHRDTREILRLGFPCFSNGAYAQDQRNRGRAVDFRCRIVFANSTKVAPGDIVVGDIDGVVIVPEDRVEEVMALALAKVAGEDDVRRMILEGARTEEIFARTGVM